MISEGTARRPSSHRPMDVFTCFVPPGPPTTDEMPPSDTPPACGVHAIRSGPPVQHDYFHWKKLNKLAQVPVRATEGSAGYDLCSPTNCMLPPGCVSVIPLGISAMIPPHFCGELHPRSGLMTQGIKELTGTLDSDYLGEISALMRNHTSGAFHILSGERII